MSRPLFAITDDLIRLNDLLDEIEGDMNRLGEMEPAITEFMDSLSGEESSKLDAYVNLIRQLESEAAVAKAEAEQYAKKGRTREARAQWLKDRLKMHMERTGRVKIETEHGRTVAIQKNGGSAPLVIDPAADIECIATTRPEFVRVVKELNKDQIRKAIEAGESFGFAMIGERGTSLRIR